MLISTNLPKTKNTDLSEFDDRFRARVCFWDRASEVIEELLQTLAALNGDDDDEWKHEQSHWTYRSSAFSALQPVLRQPWSSLLQNR